MEKRIAKGKWTIAEIVGHFKAWDEFVINSRIPYIYVKGNFPMVPDSEGINQQSAVISRSEKQQITIYKFLTTRMMLMATIEKIPDELWTEKFSIGKTHFTLSEYFSGLVQHDIHHFDQIKQTISKM